MAHVAVIGAGPSGLAAAKELLAEGHTVACFEKAPGVGGLFRYDEKNGKIWKSLKLTSSLAITGYSDFPMPRDWPTHVTHEQYTAYLNDYCDHFKLRPHISFNTQVKSLKRLEDDRWQVSICDSEGNVTTDQYDAVAVCSGLHQHNYSPELAGHEDFKGEFWHASEYRSPEHFEGRSIVFVGLGESGADVVGEIAEVTKSAYLSVRRGAAVTPRIARGLPSDYRTTRLVYSLPAWFNRPSTKASPNRKPLLRLAACAAVILVFPLWPLYIVDAFRELRYRWRFRKDPDNPKRRSWRKKISSTSGGAFYEQFGTKSDNFIEALIKGTCEYKRDIEKLTPNGVRFADGTEVEADTIMFCTGFKPHFPFVDKQYNEFRDLYKTCFDPSIGHSLGLIGCARPGFGSIPPVAEMQARWFALLVSGKRSLPSEDEMNKQIMIDKQRTMEENFPVAERLDYLINYPVYMDTVAEFVGCKPSLKRLLRSPRLFWKVLCCPFVCNQFRLEGPHANPELATRTLLNTDDGPFPNTFLLVFHVIFNLLYQAGLKTFKPNLDLPWRNPFTRPLA